MERKTAGELADFFQKFPEDKEVEFLVLDQDGDERIAGGGVYQVYGKLCIEIYPDGNAEDLWNKNRKDGELLEDL